MLVLVANMHTVSGTRNEADRSHKIPGITPDARTRFKQSCLIGVVSQVLATAQDNCHGNLLLVLLILSVFAALAHQAKGNGELVCRSGIDALTHGHGWNSVYPLPFSMCVLLLFVFVVFGIACVCVGYCCGNSRTRTVMVVLTYAVTQMEEALMKA